MPGERGPAVLVGHRDSTRGPAVFYRLGELARGDDIITTDAIGQQRTFTVTALEQVDKHSFPTERVYGKTGAEELRLITCEGAFKVGDYEDNLIVYASMRT